MRLTFSVLLVGVLLVVLGGGCDAVDPTDVENPQTTREELLGAEDPAEVLLPGLRAQFARALNAIVIASAFGSDDYSINGTGVGGTDLDFPRDITPATSVLSATDVIGAYWNLQELRALADFFFDEAVPADLAEDEQVPAAVLGEAHYLRGMAYLMQGENFVAVPTEPDGEPVPAGVLLQNAIDDFEDALELGFAGPETLAAQARAQRALGNQDAMVDLATSALEAGGPAFLITQEYDRQLLDTQIANEMQDFLVDRSLQEAQPLPRLDFLDPKYLRDESEIPVAKAEEMYLLLAEGAVASGDLDAARGHLRDAVGLVGTPTRPVVPFDDSDERLNNDLEFRPNDASIVVRADADSPFEEGLVLTRPGPVDVPIVSGTSITGEEIDAATDEEAVLRLLYLARQELLFLEGRRLHDLGIRLPMMQREIDTNPNIDDGDLGTQVFVPDYIPEDNTIDLYTPDVLYDEDGNLVATEVTILVDMNEVLAEERGAVVSTPLLP